VLIARLDAEVAVEAPEDLIAAEYRFLAVADPAAVPAGRYARAHLERRTVDGARLWDRLAGRIAPTLDVRAALALVESDPEILGVVYRTDARTSGKVRVIYEFPPLDEVPITYWGALVTDGEAPEAGTHFLEFLQGPEAAAILERHGFEAIPR
jgi:molybdate transport system substrate-binding protein